MYAGGKAADAALLRKPMMISLLRVLQGGGKIRVHEPGRFHECRIMREVSEE